MMYLMCITLMFLKVMVVVIMMTMMMPATTPFLLLCQDSVSSCLLASKRLSGGFVAGESERLGGGFVAGEPD
jgi:predicted metal-binding membrane protein